MPHAYQSRPPQARPVWQQARHPFPKRPRRADSIIRAVEKYAPKGGS